MRLIRSSVDNPAAIAAGLVLLLLLGGLALAQIPIQMLPELERPQFTVNTGWRAAAPEEVESIIIEPQERELRFINRVEEITSSIQRGFGSINLTFALGTDMQRAMLDVLSALNRTPDLPADANEPQIDGGGGRNAPFTASLLLVPMPGNPTRDMASYHWLVEELIEPRLR